MYYYYSKTRKNIFGIYLMYTYINKDELNDFIKSDTYFPFPIVENNVVRSMTRYERVKAGLEFLNIGEYVNDSTKEVILDPTNPNASTSVGSTVTNITNNVNNSTTINTTIVNNMIDERVLKIVEDVGALKYAVDDMKDLDTQVFEVALNLNKVQSDLTTLGSKLSSLPVGSIIASFDPTTPESFILCDGSLIDVLTFNSLHKKIGFTYGRNADDTRFRVPDLRGEFLRGTDLGRGVDSNRNLGSNQGFDWKGFYMMNTRQNSYDYNHNSEYHGKSTTTFIGKTFTGGWSAPAGATGTMWDSSEIRPRNVAVNYYIKY